VNDRERFARSVEVERKSFPISNESSRIKRGLKGRRSKNPSKGREGAEPEAANGKFLNPLKDTHPLSLRRQLEGEEGVGGIGER